MSIPPALLQGVSGPLVERHDVLLVDLDGVVYVGPDRVPHAVESLNRAAASVRVGYVTNNARRRPDEVAAHLRELGLVTAADDVVTSAQAGARLVAERVPAGARVLAIGGPGVSAALVERGFVPVGSADDSPAAVMQGYGPDVSWHDLAEAAYAVARGAHFIATNLDLSIPTPRGRAPGNGALVAAVVAATGVAPAVAGKPEPPLMRESIERLSAERPLVVGDRLDTDIEAGARLGLPTLLVLTGVTHVRELLAAPPGQRPDHIAADLRGLVTAHPPVHVDALGARCGSAAVRVEGESLEVLSRGDDPVDLVRAAVVAVWGCSDAGRPVDLSQAVGALDG